MTFKDKSRLIKKIAKYNLAGLFPGFLSVIKCTPLLCTIQITSRCSGRCQTCNHWKVEEHDELTTEEWKDFIICLKEIGVLSIAFSGGDILLRDDISILIALCNKLGIKTGATVNGFTVTDKVAGKLMSANISSVGLSLDSLDDDVFSDIRGVENSTEKVRRSLRLLEQNNRGGTKISIAMTVMKSTLSSIKDVTDFAVRNNLPIGFNLIHFTHYFSDTDFSREQYRLNGEEKKILHEQVMYLREKRRAYPGILPALVELEYIKNYFDDYLQKKMPCYQALLDVCIRPNGDVSPCCSMDPAGNLRKQSLNEILDSAEYIGLLKKALLKDCPGCSCRYTLSLRTSISMRIREVLLRSGLVKFL